MLIILPDQILKISNPSNFLEELKDYSVRDGEYPFLQIVVGEEQQHKFIMGYINQEGHIRQCDSLWIKKVCIKELSISYESDKKENEPILVELFGYSYFVIYHFSVKVSIDSVEHIFCCEDKLEFTYDEMEENKYKRTKRYGHHIEYLLSTIIPRINELIDNGIMARNINFDFFDKLLMSESKELNPYNISKDNILELAYRIDLIKDNHSHPYNGDSFTYYVKSKNIDKIKVYNYYIAKLFESLIDADVIKNSAEPNLYTWRLRNPSEYLKLNPQALKDFLIRELIIGVFFNYEQDSATNGFIYCETIQIQNNFKSNPNVIKLLDFVLSMRATKKLHGQYRVGRDDIEYQVHSVYFPSIGYHPSAYLIDLINETLNIKLELDDKNFCYKYIESESEYVPWLARNEDYGSEAYQNSLFIRLVNKLLPLMENNTISFFEDASVK